MVCEELVPLSWLRLPPVMFGFVNVLDDSGLAKGGFEECGREFVGNAVCQWNTVTRLKES